ncbi:uncharacterized protein LOC130945993 [Arachis stenosperma]|uniref:uncharacterized protein LOC130945993 n=1 Tax=Arachis stenosperma TaxID=217475 RepID=UPI0025AD6FA6|nr:uncharacterized protein LOC130945993 [Arachis stenosperma]
MHDSEDGETETHKRVQVYFFVQCGAENSNQDNDKYDETLLPQIIRENQSAFVPRRLKTDNGLVTFNIFYYMKKKVTGQKGYIGMKLDLKKAYDGNEWEFLREVLQAMGFPKRLTQTIWNCINTTSFSIFINGRPSKLFQPSRGLSQEDSYPLIYSYPMLRF